MLTPQVNSANPCIGCAVHAAPGRGPSTERPIRGPCAGRAYLLLPSWLDGVVAGRSPWRVAGGFSVLRRVGRPVATGRLADLVLAGSLGHPPLGLAVGTAMSPSVRAAIIHTRDNSSNLSRRSALVASPACRAHSRAYSICDSSEQK